MRELFLADLVATFIFENTTHLFKPYSVFERIFRDGGIIVFEGLRSQIEIDDWLKGFQCKVDDLLESTKLKFTVEIWKPLVIVFRDMKISGIEIPDENREAGIIKTMKYDGEDEMYQTAAKEPEFDMEEDMQLETESSNEIYTQPEFTVKRRKTRANDRSQIIEWINSQENQLPIEENKRCRVKFDERNFLPIWKEEELDLDVLQS